MNAPIATAPTKWFVRPAIVMPVVLALVVASALLAPDPIAGRAGDPRLSTNSTGAQGARVFYDVAKRFGWKVERLNRNVYPSSPDVVYGVLSPRLELLPSDVHALLQHVRAGGGLYVVLGAGTTALSDSLHVTVGISGVGIRDSADSAKNCPKQPAGSFAPLWYDGTTHLNTVRFTRPTTTVIDTLLRINPDMGRAFPTPTPTPKAIPRATMPKPIVIRADSGDFPADTMPWRRGERPAMIGFAFGAGRIIVAADPDLLRNDAIRVCGNGLDVAAMRGLEYSAAGGAVPRRTLRVDEYHHGYGAQPGTMTATWSFLSGMPVGHFLTQLAAASLLLLLALAPRGVAPVDVSRLERRSPLEHVDALARAYAQVGATRTASARLVRGLRRRSDRGMSHRGRRESDAQFLDRITLAYPAVAADTALLQNALSSSLTVSQFAAVSPAVHRLETALARV